MIIKWSIIFFYKCPRHSKMSFHLLFHSNEANKLSLEDYLSLLDNGYAEHCVKESEVFVD